MNESFVTVVGNVVSDPISRPTKVGRPFASLRIASTTRRWDAEKRAFVDGSTNFLNVVAFNALAANVMTSVKKGHPVVVYGRLRVNQWETEKGEPRTSAEIDAFTIGHDLTRGQVEFSRPPRVQLDTNDRLADPAIQDTFHGEAAGADESDESDESDGSDGSDGSDESGMRGVEEDSTDEGVVVQGGFGQSGFGQSGFGQSGFGRRVEDADTDDYVVVNGG
ncbi:MAG TPA: single-stranded DNA-binding protein [Lapillicoccus sp.]|uniref:single-stranded DNA-binding protein n=1 Tax=Lapillicoccus sp. TaxID=1909287 RepID=UPI002F92632A